MITNHPSDVLCPLPRRIERVRVSITSPLVQPSPNGRRVGIRIVTFEACSGFTRVTARRIAQPPKVTFVTRLRSRQLPSETARQLPDLSTIIRVEPSSTDDSRLQGALPLPDFIRQRGFEDQKSRRLSIERLELRLRLLQIGSGACRHATSNRSNSFRRPTRASRANARPRTG